MEALKTDFPSSVLPEHPLRSPPCEHFQCSGPVLIFIVIGPFQNHYATYYTVGAFDWSPLAYTAHRIFCVSVFM